MWLSHTHPDPAACSQQLNSHIFQTDGSRSSTSDSALYFIYHISSVHLMLPIAVLYGLNITQHFLERWRCSFLIIHDNCSNISLPAWFQMAQHRIQSNKRACVGIKQFRAVRKFSESKTRLRTATNWKDKTVSHSTYRKITPAFTAW